MDPFKSLVKLAPSLKNVFKCIKQNEIYGSLQTFLESKSHKILCYLNLLLNEKLNFS